MAVKDSEELKSDERYPLGEYSFRIERSSVPGSTNDKIEAICTDKDGKNARKSIQIPSSTQLLGWYVEANETEASVYAIVMGAEMPGVVQPFLPSILIPGSEYGGRILTITSGSSSMLKTIYYDPGNTVNASLTPVSTRFYNPATQGWGMGYGAENSFTYDGKTVYWGAASASFDYWNTFGTGQKSAQQVLPENMLAWMMFYGGSGGEQTDKLVARFAINLEDAGGDGPGSDWTDPGDYDPDWEEGDPTHTLYVTVTGALSGRHNDPIVDPSYSYIPADKDTVKDYGCGGDGGHGGGGGAGASTVVIHKFATNQANSKEVTAIARRHGYGSGGGKGGKGGDGCILVYY